MEGNVSGPSSFVHYCSLFPAHQFMRTAEVQGIRSVLRPSCVPLSLSSRSEASKQENRGCVVCLSKLLHPQTPIILFSKAINDAVFTEQRRQDLRRFLLLILRHPVLGKDECVTFFLTAAGQVDTPSLPAMDRAIQISKTIIHFCLT